MDRWRAKPFERYPAIGDKFLSIIPGQGHGQIGGGGAPAVQAYQAENTAAFFDVYLRGRVIRVCEIGTIAPISGVTFERTLDPKGLGPRRCSPLDIVALASHEPPRSVRATRASFHHLTVSLVKRC